uniref:2Fe-2S iron-sulfur cluster-binding protein n=1 Tax=Janibacter limosus TaxID=53458 RepID=A0AC61U5N0_9MICO|nr:2Fe-2S iron-sulfur cluster-binding protein [Janibacter limosus]
MSVTSDKNPTSDEVKPDLIGVTIDGIAVSVPKNTLVIRAAEEAGIEIPRFCDHPLPEPVGACRQCLVEVATPDREGNVKPMPKPQASCTMTVSEGMQVRTQHSSPVADKAQQGIMEMLLINHPLDCPVCDKGGECPLQNQSMSNGRATSRFEDVKRTYPKPINISSRVLLDRDRCVLCARCTRFSDQIAGDPFIALVEARCPPAGRHLRGPALRVLLLGQHGPDLPRGRAHGGGLPLPVASLRPRLHLRRLRALRRRLLDPHRPPPRHGPATDGGQ